MNTTSSTTSNDSRMFIIYFASSIVLTTFLFYIDEGHYNFKWMQTFGNWVAFFIYVIALFLGQSIVHGIIIRIYKGNSKAFLTVLFGIPLGIALVYTFFYLIKI